MDDKKIKELLAKFGYENPDPMIMSAAAVFYNRGLTDGIDKMYKIVYPPKNGEADD